MSTWLVMTLIRKGSLNTNSNNGAGRRVSRELFLVVLAALGLFWGARG